MSNVSNRHNLVPFTAGKSVPFDGQRLAKIGYKTTKNQSAKYKSVCVSVPFLPALDIIDNSEQLLPYVRTYLESVQDSIVRSLYESAEGNLSSVSDDEIGVDACIAYLEAESSGGRLKKEQIESWFDENVKENLFTLVAEKLGFSDITPDAEQTVNKHVKVYKDVISSLAGGKTFLQPVQIKGCKTALGLVQDEDEMYKRLMARLDGMEKKEKIEDLLEL